MHFTFADYFYNVHSCAATNIKYVSVFINVAVYEVVGVISIMSEMSVKSGHVRIMPLSSCSCRISLNVWFDSDTPQCNTLRWRLSREKNCSSIFNCEKHDSSNFALKYTSTMSRRSGCEHFHTFIFLQAL